MDKVSDFCFLVQDLERAVHFYRDVVGFRLRRLAPGFADFFTGGATLALWQVDHMQPISCCRRDRHSAGWRAMAAVHGRQQ